MANPNPTSVKVSNANAAPQAANKPAAKNHSKPTPASNPSTQPGYQIRWLSLIGLSLIAIELVLNSQFIWGLFGFIWVANNIRTNQTYILELLDRRTHPILFWITISLWIGLAAYFFTANPTIYAIIEYAITSVVKLLPI